MANVKIDLGSPVYHGQTLTFKSPADCSEVTGLAIYYYENGVKTSQTFQFADAHGSNVGSVDLFAADVLVKVILDTEKKRAYVQNADTNAYLEKRIIGTLTHTKSGTVHRLTGLGDRSGFISVVFKASANFVEGDTFTVDGVTYTAKLQNGEIPEDDLFVSGTIVPCIIDTDGKTVNFKNAGVSLPELTNPANASHIKSGYQAIDAEGEIINGTNKAELAVLSGSYGSLDAKEDASITINVKPSKIYAIFVEQTWYTGFVLVDGKLTSDKSFMTSPPSMDGGAKISYKSSSACTLIIDGSTDYGSSTNKYWVIYRTP